MKKVFKIIGYVVLSFLLLIAVFNIWVVASASQFVSTDIQEVPPHKMALVLGTSRLNSAGQNNGYFDQRMEAVAKLYAQGKIEHVIVSGDNRSVYYDEPQDMSEALINLGVPEDAITSDDAGLRTLDSVVRCKDVFGQRDVLIVTQAFHLYRAIFIARYNDMNVAGFAASEPEQVSRMVELREIAARTIAVLDLYLFNTQPIGIENKEK